MKKIKFFACSALVVTLFTISCTTNTMKKVPDMHTSQNATDYDGIYRGIIPCADCPGIKYTVWINRDGTFRTQMEYMERNTKIESKGTYGWDKNGSVIILKADNESPVRFLVGENMLTQLDGDGNRITGDLADNFILTKANYALLNKKWNLTEIFGQKADVLHTLKKEAFVRFNDADNRYSASAGCNSISGSFDILPLGKLKFGQGMSTMMACPDMKLEEQLSSVLQIADTFRINGDELILSKEGKGVLAKFRTPVQ